MSDERDPGPEPAEAPAGARVPRQAWPPGPPEPAAAHVALVAAEWWTLVGIVAAVAIVVLAGKDVASPALRAMPLIALLWLATGPWLLRTFADRAGLSGGDRGNAWRSFAVFAFVVVFVVAIGFGSAFMAIAD